MDLYFACSDIHSFYDEWINALKSNGFELNNPEHKIIICGDLFDRGNQSVECYEFAKSMNDQCRLIYVRGNHEDLLNNCLASMNNISSHHKSNGTIRTISNFLECTEIDVMMGTYDYRYFKTKIDPLVDFINKNTVDYFELGDKIFVHGWVPITCDNNNEMIVHENWRDGDWRHARWENGMEMAKFGLTVPDKIVVCGHWHTSYGHSNISRICSEWGRDACFDVFMYDGVIALDACTAYTKQVNIVKFDSEGHII